MVHFLDYGSVEIPKVSYDVKAGRYYIEISARFPCIHRRTRVPAGMVSFAVTPIQPFSSISLSTEEWFRCGPGRAICMIRTNSDTVKSCAVRMQDAGLSPQSCSPLSNGAGGTSPARVGPARRVATSATKANLVMMTSFR